MTSEPTRPFELFYSYAHEDEKLRDKLDNHLTLLQRQGFITEWHDRRIEAGGDWAGEINEHLDSADIILMLVSDDFIASDYCYGVEMKRALERHDQGEARVVPVILRDVDWESSPLGGLQALPKDGKPVTSWRNRDQALKNVAQGIREIIKTFRPKQKSASAPVHIPRRPSFGFVSRRDEQGRDIVERLDEELAPGQNNLVTLSGPGGIGKTTLAAEAARSLLEAYARRVVWSSADGRTDFTLLTLLDDIATQLGSPQLRTLAPEAKAEQVRALVSNPPALVVLDNYETITAEEQRRTLEWFAQAQCSALFTSRPRILGTVFIPVSAMSPAEAEDFLDKLIRQTQDPPMFTSEVRRRIYETAEANPFVMQWVVGQIGEARVPETVFEELTGGEGDAAERVFARSFNLPQLGDDGRDVLHALSLFAPSASREALASVAGFGDGWKKRLDDAVKNLHALWLIKGVDGYRRLAVEGLTRTLIEARLSKDSRAADFRRRFVAYFLRHAEEHEARTPENYDSLEAEKDNLLKAAEVAFASEDFHSVMLMTDAVATPVNGMFSVRGYWDETVGLGEQALQAARFSQNERAVAGFSHNLAVMYGNRGELTKARQLYEESLEIKKRLGDQGGVAHTLHELAVLAQDQGQLEDARQLYEESLEITQTLDDQYSVASTLHQLAMLAQDQGELKKARRLYEESLEIKKRLGDQRGVAYTFGQLGNLALNQGEIAEARKLYNQCLEISRTLGDQGSIAKSQHQLGMLAQDEGKLDEARRLYDESLEIQRRLGDQHGVATTLGQLGYLAAVNDDKAEAARLFRESLSIFERLGSPYAEVVRQNLKRVEGSTADEDS